MILLLLVESDKAFAAILPGPYLTNPQQYRPEAEHQAPHAPRPDDQLQNRAPLSRIAANNCSIPVPDVSLVALISQHDATDSSPERASQNISAYAVE